MFMKDVYDEPSVLADKYPDMINEKYSVRSVFELDA